MTEPVWVIVAGDDVGVPKRWWTGTEWSKKPEEAREYDIKDIRDEGHRLLQKMQWPWIKAVKQGVEIKREAY